MPALRCDVSLKSETETSNNLAFFIFFAERHRKRAEHLNVRMRTISP